MPKLDIGYVDDEMTGQPDGDEDEGHSAGRRRGLGWVDANDSPAPKRHKFDGSRASRDVRSDGELLPVSPAQATNGTNADVSMDPDGADDAQTDHGGPTGGFRLHLHASRPVNITVDVPRPPVLDPRRQTPPPDDSGRWPGYDEGEAGEVQAADWDSADQPRAQGGIERRGGYDSSENAVAYGGRWSCDRILKAIEQVYPVEESDPPGLQTIQLRPYQKQARGLDLHQRACSEFGTALHSCSEFGRA